MIHNLVRVPHHLVGIRILTMAVRLVIRLEVAVLVDRVLQQRQRFPLLLLLVHQLRLHQVTAHFHQLLESLVVVR